MIGKLPGECVEEVKKWHYLDIVHYYQNAKDLKKPDFDSCGTVNHSASSQMKMS